MGIPQSVHQHYATVKILATELEQRLIYYKLKDAYTLSKDELVLVFTDRDQHYFTIKIVQQYQTCFLFFDDIQPEKVSNAQSCFEECLNTAITAVEQHPFNRSFALVFANKMQLVFKLYDGLVNVLLFAEGKVEDMFRKSILNDWELTLQSFVSNQTNETIEAKAFFLYKRNHIHPFYISFSKQPDELITQSKSAIEILNAFSKKCLAYYRFTHLKQQLLSSIEQQLQKNRKHQAELEQVAKQRSLQTTDEEIANILMANLHLIKQGNSGVELFNFYNNTNIKIKLKKDLNAQQNAAYYYRKYKNSNIERLQNEQHIQSLTKKYEELLTKQLQIEKAVSLKELKPFVKVTTPQAKQFPFRKFEYDGFEIWVGKSAANNDELTMRHSHKNDLWLHAKDVTGSHVLIKWKPGKEYSPKLIEYAAQLAAYYSKLKGSSLVPVSYTLKKFVRKPKGAQPGSVVVDKEETIMVRPVLG
jgi:predicted ribosome quality control (RQC) complex YloA/Tae2 family protein